jgi:tRNA-binding protein
MATMNPFEALQQVDLRVGRILEARPFPEARKPAYQLRLDLGPELGVRQSSAQITERYRPEDLAGRKVIVVANLEPRRIAGFRSEVLVLGADDPAGRVALLAPEEDTEPGQRVY